MKINFKTLGEIEKNDLDITKPIVYQSDSLISSMNYAGEIEIIEKTQAFSDDFKRELKKINGLASVGTTNGRYRNIHIYSKNAKRLDGLNRICYIRKNNSGITVSEYSGNRSAKYSSLYPLLEKYLLKEGFQMVNDKFDIELPRVADLVKTINKIIEMHLTNQLELKVVNEIDSIVIKKDNKRRRYYYFKVFYIEKNNNNQLDKRKYEAMNIISDIEFIIENIANTIITSKNKDQLFKIKNKLSKLENVIDKRIENIEDFEAITD